MINFSHEHIGDDDGCLESIWPFWISWELVECPWCNLATSQRRPYCASVTSHSPVGLISDQWDAVDWTCAPCDCHIQNDWASRSASSWLCSCSFYSSCAGFFGKSSHHPGLSAPSYSQDLTHCDFWVFPKLKSPCSHSTQSQSVASRYWLTILTGEWLFMDAQESLLWLAAKLHKDHATGSRNIHNGWILSWQTSYLYWKHTWHWGVVEQIIQCDLCTAEETRMTRLVGVVRIWTGKIINVCLVVLASAFSLDTSIVMKSCDYEHTWDRDFNGNVATFYFLMTIWLKVMAWGRVCLEKLVIPESVKFQC
jgi:hypothetical protein